MQRKKIIIAVVVFVIVIFGAYFGLKRFRQVKADNQSSQMQGRSVTSIQKADAVEQEIAANENEPASTQQESIDNVQPESGRAQDLKTENQSKVTVNDSSDAGKILQKSVSWGFQKSTGRKIDTLVIHTSYNALGGDVYDKEKVVQEWKDAGVSPHYMIDRGGNIYQLVDDQNIAWHAGAAKTPDGRTDVNSFSIGIEVINSQEGKFSDAQYSSLNSLIGILKKRHSIKYVLGHDEIAPGRKTDPWGIDWKKVRR